MQGNTNCLDQAMFIASESYSGSAYSTNLSWSINELCNKVLALLPPEDWAISSMPITA
jgi:hypothetical protein